VMCPLVPPWARRCWASLTAKKDSNMTWKCDDNYGPFQPKLMRHPRLPKQHQWVRTNSLVALIIVSKNGYFW
jgi:hypothetical protein